MSAGAKLQSPMTDAEYRMFCDLVRSHCGLHFGPESRFLMEKRLTRRVEALGLGSFAAYSYHLRSGPAGDEELSQLIDSLTTNETYFFRELNQLRTLIDEVIPELMHRRGGSQRPISIWSAGCSSGDDTPHSAPTLADPAPADPAPAPDPAGAPDPEPGPAPADPAPIPGFTYNVGIFQDLQDLSGKAHKGPYMGP